MKFYITCGNLEFVVMAKTGMEACAKALIRWKDRELDQYFCVDQRGFKNKFSCQWWYKLEDVNMFVEKF